MGRDKQGSDEEMTLREWIARERSLGHIDGPRTRGHGRGGGEGRSQVNESSSSEEELVLFPTKRRGGLRYEIGTIW